MMMKKSILVLMAAAAMVSCSDNNDVVMPSGDSAAIRLNSVTYEVNASTRAPFEGTISTTNTLKARVVGMVGKEETPTVLDELWSDGVMTFNGSGAVAYDLSSMNSGDKSEGKYPTEKSDKVELYGFYPAAAWTGAASYTATFTGKEDVMATVGSGSTVITTGKEAEDGTFGTLTFKHLLTKLDVRVKADQPAIADFGEVVSIKLIGATDGEQVVNTVVYDMTEDEVKNGEIDTEESPLFINFYRMSANEEDEKSYTDVAYTGQNYTLTQSPEYVAYAIVAPHASLKADGIAYHLEVVTSKRSDALSVPVYLKQADGKTAYTASTVGYSFNVLLHFQASGYIKADAVVVDEWKEGGNTTSPIN